MRFSHLFYSAIAFAFVLLFPTLVAAQQGVGIGPAVVVPVEMLDVDGGIKIGTTSNTNAGTIRWNGTSFEGYDGTQWITFGAASDGDWTVSGSSLYRTGGNIGIGTATPTGKLHVELTNGDFKLLNNAGNAGVVILGRLQGANGNNPQFRINGSGGSHDIGQDATGNFVIEHSDVARLVIKDDGNVGIGTSTPSAKLYVANTTGVNTTSKVESGSAQYPVAISVLPSTHATSRRTALKLDDWQLLQDKGGNGTKDFSIYQTTGNAQRLTINTSGNVGIGTAAPANLLDLSNGTRTGTHATGAPLYVTGAIGASDNGIEFKHNNGTQGIGFGFNTIYAAGSNPNQHVNILPKGTGRVGIGTIAPGAMLHVEGAITMVDGNQLAGRIPVSDVNGKMTWTDPTTITVSTDEIADADNDTKIQVEESADEDIIRFDVGGTEQWSMVDNRLENTDNSLYIGNDAGLADNTGAASTNTGVGINALKANTSNGSTAVGYNALGNATAGGNTAVGKGGLNNTSSGAINTAVGQDAGYENETGAENVFIGQGAMATNKTGSSNVAIGRNAGRAGGSRSGNVYLGYQAGNGATGDNKLYIENSNSTSPLIYGEFDNDIVTINGNLGIGAAPTDELYVANSTSSATTATIESGSALYPIAINVLPSAHATSRRTVLKLDDWQILQDRVGNGTKDLAIYQQSANANRIVINTSGNVGIGDPTPDATLDVEGSIQMVDGNQLAGRIPVSDANGTMTWTDPSAISGVNELSDDDNDTKIQVEESADEDIIRFDIAGTEVLTIRKNAGGETMFETPNSGDNSTHFGQHAGESSNTGTYNAFFGKRAGASITNGGSNTLIGYEAGQSNITGSSNTFVGRTAGRNATGGDNVFIGRDAGLNGTGSDNTFVGRSAGYNATGSRNVFIGKAAGFNETGDNRLYIDNSNTSTPLIYGDFGSNALKVNGTLEVTGIINTNNQWISGDGGAEGIYIADDGKIGVGINSPDAALSVLGPVRGSYDATETEYVEIDHGGAHGFINTVGDGNLDFRHDGNTLMSLLDNGFLGVGTNSPQLSFHVHRNSSDHALALFTNNTTGSTSDDGLFVGIGVNEEGLLKQQENKDLILGTNDINRVWIKNNGRVGIGTSTVNKGWVVISESLSYDDVTGVGLGSDAWGLPVWDTNFGDDNYSLYASGAISCTQINVRSDARIKDVIGQSNSTTDLALLNKLEVTDYQMKDRIKFGNRPFKKLIAQQVESVYPQAVAKRTTSSIPDIMKPTKMENGKVELTGNDLKQGERVELIFGSEKIVFEVLTADENSFTVDCQREGEVFVYGREVNDFHSVDYEAISMLNVSATQQLAKENEALKARIAQLESTFSSFTAEMEELKASLGVDIVGSNTK